MELAVAGDAVDVGLANVFPRANDAFLKANKIVGKNLLIETEARCPRIDPSTAVGRNFRRNPEAGNRRHGPRGGNAIDAGRQIVEGPNGLRISVAAVLVTTVESPPKDPGEELEANASPTSFGTKPGSPSSTIWAVMTDFLRSRPMLSY